MSTRDEWAHTADGLRDLDGVRVVVTRSRRGASALCRVLSAHGAVPIEIPAQRHVARPAGLRDLSALVRELTTSERSPGARWLVVTSATTVRTIVDALDGTDVVDALRTIPVAAVGSATARAASLAGFSVALVPERYDAEGLVEAFSGVDVSGADVLLPCAVLARNVIETSLRERGASVHRLDVYDVEVPIESARTLAQAVEVGFDWLTFASSHTVRAFLQLVDVVAPTAHEAGPRHGGPGDDSSSTDARAYIMRTPVAAIGPLTAETARAHGLRVCAVPQTATLAATVLALSEAHRSGVRRLVADAS